MYYSLQGDQDGLHASIDYDIMIQGAIRFYFTLDSNTDVTMGYGGAYNDMLLYVSDSNSGEVLNVDGAHSATLGAGQYYVLFLQDMDGGSNGTFGYLDLTFDPVPAPSALALLGIAGFATRRRRR